MQHIRYIRWNQKVFVGTYDLCFIHESTFLSLSVEKLFQLVFAVLIIAKAVYLFAAVSGFV
mgnify:CR=1 FL=1